MIHTQGRLNIFLSEINAVILDLKPKAILKPNFLIV